MLTYHVVPGSFDSVSLTKMINANGGKAELKTASGNILIASLNGSKNVIIKDENGNIANITTYDVYQSNGVIHVIDTVVLPK